MTPVNGPDARPPVVAIVGCAGAYGRWLTCFLSERMGLQVIGHDPALADSLSPRTLLQRADVVVFSTPIRDTPAIIESFARLADGIEAGQLWLDLTSVKQAPVQSMLGSRAEVAGLHPMAAPPKTVTLKGHTMAVCRARILRWQAWLDALLEELQADCVEIDPQAHDRAMALVQGLVHATHMVQAKVLCVLAADAGGLPSLHGLRTTGHQLDLAVTGRILSGNPAIYTGIQFDNPHMPAVLARLAAAAAELRDAVADGSSDARTAVAERFLQVPAAWFGDSVLAACSHDFERMGYLQADLQDRRFISVYLPQDRPGSLRALLDVFERLGINLASIHSSRTPDGKLHFRIGLDRLPVALESLRAAVEDAGIGLVLDARDGD